MTQLNNPQQNATVCAHVWISGKVQGVGYRPSAQSEAVKRDIKGWIRNLPDGRVEALFEGEKTAVEQMIQWSHQGPAAAVVKDVNVEYETSQGYSEFQVAA